MRVFNHNQRENGRLIVESKKHPRLHNREVRGYEEPDFTPEDMAVIDAVWDEIRAEKARELAQTAAADAHTAVAGATDVAGGSEEK